MDLPLELRAAGAPDAASSRIGVLVRAGAGTPFGAARPLLSRAAGAPPGATWWCGTDPLSDTQPLGREPLVDGAELAWRPADPRPAPSPDPGPAPSAGLGPAPCAGQDNPTGLEVRVMAGPDAGLILPLPDGPTILGRGSGAALCLADPGLSRRHARLVVARDGVTIADLGTANGTAVDGVPIGSVPRPLPPGLPVTVSSTVLHLAVGHRPPAQAENALRGTPANSRGPADDGTVGVHRSPRVRAARAESWVTLPAAPNPGDPPRFSMLVLVLPLVVAAVAAVVLKTPVYLAFGLLGPAMSVAQFRADRRRHAERTVADGQRHAETLARLRDDLARRLERERAERRADCPDLDVLTQACLHRTPALWARRPGDADWLELSLGWGSVRARAGVRGPDGVVAHPELAELPVPVSLPRWGVVGLAPDALDPHEPHEPGPAHADRTAASAALARAVLAQALAWHSPADLRIWVLAADPAGLAEWSWLCAAPHTRDPESPYPARCGVPGESLARVVAELTGILDEHDPAGADRSPAGLGGPDPTPPGHLLLLAGGRSLAQQPGLARLLRDGPARGLVALCLADSPDELPGECRAVATVAGSGAGVTVRLVTPQDLVVARPDGLRPTLAHRLGRALAPLRDVTPGSRAALPDVVRLTDSYGPDVFDAARQAQRWRSRPASTAFILGLDAAGPAEYDLRRDGPHALVGGTTGAGKSELLRALLVALALGNRPDRLAFVLVDYKGGAAFDACAHLPHTVGLVTDLDAEQTRRALAGLEAELTTREARLRAVGAGDLDEYAARVDAGATAPDGTRLHHLPRLVIVVDEFRALAEELPDFVTGLVRLAALGRSLGLHLVLATQRPAGIVSADMRANLALRIALRVRDAVDSLDIVESEQAAAISPRRPGRAVVRTGSATPLVIQTSYLGGTATTGDGTDPIEVHRLDAADLLTPWADLPILAAASAASAASAPATSATSDPDALPRPADASPADSDVRRVARTLAEAAMLVDAHPAPPPWLPPLPTSVAVRELTSYDVGQVTPARGTAHPTAAPADHPTANPPADRRDCETPLAPVLLVDDPARQRQWAGTWQPVAGSHLAVVGGPRSGRSTTLRSLTVAALDAHCPARLTAYLIDGSGALAPLARYPHVGAYLRLDEDGALRRLVGALRDAAQAGRPIDGAVRLLVVDGWEQLRAVLDRIDHGGGTESLVQAVRGGAGLTLLAAGGRELLTGPLATILAERFVLDLADPTDAYLAGLDVRAGRVPPGRVRLGGSGLGAQVARYGPLAPVHEHAHDQTQIATAAPTEEPTIAARAASSLARHTGCPGPRLRVRSLPGRVGPEELRADGEPGALALGLAGDGSVATVVLDGRGLIVAGPRGSGRSTALRRLFAVLQDAGGPPALSLSGRDPQLSPAELGAQLRDQQGTVCLVDDVDALLGGPYDDVLAEFATNPRAGSLVLAGTLGTLVSAYRGVVGVLRRSTYGLLLCPGPRGAELFGIALPDGEPPLPGRGFLVEEHRVRAVQVADQRAGEPS
ncbi:MAG: FHA domain-containing protein [Actinobacteria bacterium]|nr:FHA domain-containing protein [Actinomycetota bacterium]